MIAAFYIIGWAAWTILLTRSSLLDIEDRPPRDWEVGATLAVCLIICSVFWIPLGVQTILGKNKLWR